MDWSTSTIVRARKEPPETGGWNLLHTWWVARDVINPVVHFGLSGAGPNAWFGWPDIPALEKLVAGWIREADESKRVQLAADIQKVAFTEVPYVPWGQWVTPTAFRRNVRDVLRFGAPVFWNVKLA
jgi:peptide/nickel transport system substrate-binding protein